MALCHTKGKIKHLEKEVSSWADIIGDDLQDKVGLEDSCKSCLWPEHSHGSHPPHCLVQTAHLAFRILHSLALSTSARRGPFPFPSHPLQLTAALVLSPLWVAWPLVRYISPPFPPYLSLLTHNVKGPGSQRSPSFMLLCKAHPPTWPYQ